MAKKYRYFMNGIISPTDGEEYEINIPSPYLYNSKNEAMKAQSFGYRFILLDKNVGPQIVIFENENLKNENQACVSGKPIAMYDFSEFKKLGGYIRMLKPECKCLAYIDGNTDFVDTEKTFVDIFPNMQEQRLYYIDNEAYYIKEH